MRNIISPTEMFHRRVATLVSGHREPGAYHVTWDGRRNDGTTTSGLYFAKRSTRRSRGRRSSG